MNDKCKWIFSSKLMISFRSASKLNNYLVRPKIYAIERSVGSFKCVKKRCEVCENVNKTKTFTSSVTLKIHKINHKLNCDDKCLIYFWTKIFRKRWNNYKNNARKFLRKDSCMQQHLFEHFQSPGHTSFIENVYITLTGKTDPFVPTKREYCWRQTLKALAPHGLNIEESV